LHFSLPTKINATVPIEQAHSEVLNYNAVETSGIWRGWEAIFAISYKHLYCLAPALAGPGAD